jgi:hypothetical protein
MTTKNEDDRAVLHDVARFAGHRSFFLLGWCSGRCDTIPPRVPIDTDAQRRLTAQLTTDDRDAEDWMRGYRAGLAGTKNALLVALDFAEAKNEFRAGDHVEWTDSQGNVRGGLIVKGNLGDDWPSVQVTRIDGTTQTVSMTPRGLRRLP